MEGQEGAAAGSTMVRGFKSGRVQGREGGMVKGQEGKGHKSGRARGQEGKRAQEWEGKRTGGQKGTRVEGRKGERVGGHKDLCLWSHLVKLSMIDICNNVGHCFALQYSVSREHSTFSIQNPSVDCFTTLYYCNN